MIKNYFKIAIRNLRRNKLYMSINIMGLALGITCAILIFSLIKYHLRFDDFHANSNRIYRIVTEQHRDNISYVSAVPSPLGKTIRNDYTFAEKVSRIATFENTLISFETKTGTAKFKEPEGVSFTEPEYFDIFNFPMVKGNKNSQLTEPNTAIITRNIANKYFGNEDPINKTFKIDNKIDIRVTGVLANLPNNTDQKCEIYVSYSTMKQYNEWLASDDSWGGIQSAMKCFILLRPNIQPQQVEAVLPAYVKKYRSTSKNVHHYKLQPLSDIHFNAQYGGQMEKKNLWVLSLIGLFLIISACVNFVNLATAQALNRAKEIGVRKVLGSSRSQLFWQFIAETGLITVFAVMMALVLSYILLPFVNQLFNSQITINLLSDKTLLLFIPFLALIVTIFAGFYPGLILSGFKPIQALKSKIMQKNPGGINTRRSLIITQFAISQILIIGTILIALQMKYAKQSDMGFNKDAVVMIPIPSPEKAKNVKNELKRIAGVENVSLCYTSPSSRIYWQTTPRYDNRSEEEVFRISMRPADDDYLKTFGLELVAGRNLSPSDTTKEFLVNEMFIRKLNLTSPNEVLGKNLTVNGDEKGPIVGVLKDFHDASFHENINAVCISSMSSRYGDYAVKINLSNVPATLAAIEETWSKVHPDQIYEHEFLDEQIASFYQAEAMNLKLIQVFSLIAIFIGCLGLYGLASFMAAQKTKEIGIRKVLGSTISQILWIFGKEFFRLILVAFLIAAPIAWWLMNSWLQNFEFRIPISPWIFVLAILVSVVIALFTVSYRSIRAAVANPAKSLRSE